MPSESRAPVVGGAYVYCDLPIELERGHGGVTWTACTWRKRLRHHGLRKFRRHLLRKHG